VAVSLGCNDLCGSDQAVDQSPLKVRATFADEVVATRLKVTTGPPELGDRDRKEVAATIWDLVRGGGDVGAPLWI
jgi:hypothetical protein